jgi:thiamine-phosphate pyrophosphorylase
VWPLILISDAARLGEERFLEVLAAARAGGLPALQVREPSWSEARVRRLIERVIERVSGPAAARAAGGAAGGGLAVIVNRRLPLALELALAGVHLGGGDLEGVARARELLGPSRLVGYSAHSLAEIDAARLRGASYASYSPIFPPLSKRPPLRSVGLEGLSAACALGVLPICALGGMTPERAREVRAAGAAGIAAMGAILDAPDPEAVTRSFLEAWGGLGKEIGPCP